MNLFDAPYEEQEPLYNIGATIAGIIVIGSPVAAFLALWLL